MDALDEFMSRPTAETVSANTVRTHVQNLLRHAEVHSTLALIAAARELEDRRRPRVDLEVAWRSPPVPLVRLT